jgi:putative DNA primase/helicase
MTNLTPPDDLSELDQWVLWRYEDRRGKPTKLPYQSGRRYASSTDPNTWASFETVTAE